MKDLKIYLIVAFFMLGLYLFVEYNKPIPLDWTPTFNRTDKIPFGTYVLYHELPQLFKAGITSARESITETLQKADTSSLLIIAPSIDISTVDYQRMREHMNKGNDIFIAANNFNHSLLDSLNLALQSRDILFAKDSLRFHFLNPRLDSTKNYKFDRGMASHYFSKFDTTKTIVLARNNKGDANFLRYQYGSGSLYLLASPDFFSNYALLNTEGALFAATALSYLNPDRQLLYDEFQLLGMRGAKSVLRVIFENPALKWAYYITLLGLVLFVLYEIKRRQRVIPLVDPMSNTSVEFAKVVGSIYYQQRDNKDIANKKVIYLLNYIRTNYRLKTRDLNDEFQELLIQRSGANADTVRELIKEIKAIYKGKYLNDQELIELNNNIEAFYDQSGTYGTRIF
ncbi:DUF4350 domain-containing protein [Olivibacter domesticus]|uniref:DUF4350 domain-containing protein n=1 Tax=Olivibacter domesticus TaxID=407022 RepID=A0A1H7TFN2_OLID1|nr:DUF4350 domain-containing protein [Olivibacter domesticus]SEL83488.1 protein of unknown function [Olivibacter domesticus]